jgi:hypothetical protein
VPTAHVIRIPRGVYTPALVPALSRSLLRTVDISTDKTGFYVPSTKSYDDYQRFGVRAFVPGALCCSPPARVRHCIMDKHYAYITLSDSSRHVVFKDCREWTCVPAGGCDGEHDATSKRRAAEPDLHDDRASKRLALARADA